jgi:hypothetical protein
MKKVQLLQVAVFIVFAALFLQEATPGLYKSFQEGLKDGMAYKSKPETETMLIPSVVVGGDLIKAKDAKLSVNKNYALEDISINADLRVNADLLNAPWWLIVLHVILVWTILFLLVRLSLTMNNIIFNIYTGAIFNKKSVSQILQVGLLLIVYSIIDYGYQLEEFFKSKCLVNAPLTILNTSAFNFELLLAGLLALIVAEAFKQGALLKEEQELTV